MARVFVNISIIIQLSFKVKANIVQKMQQGGVSTQTDRSVT